jgi:hypothetical protein
MNQTSEIQAILSGDDLKTEIVRSIENSDDGFVPVMQAAKWLAHYPRPIQTAQANRIDSIGGPQLSITWQGLALISNELAKRDGPNDSNHDLADTEYRKGGTGNTKVSVNLLCHVAQESKRKSLFRLLKETLKSLEVRDAAISRIEDESKAPVVASQTERIGSKGKPWTDEKLKMIATYRAENGTQKAAEHFGISTALIRKKLPNEKTNKRNSSPFGYMTNTLKR